MRPEETTIAVEQTVEVRVVVDGPAVLFAERQRAIEERLLNRFEHADNGPRDSVLRYRSFLARIAARQHDLILVEIFRAKLHTQRNPTLLPIVELPSRTMLIA